MALLNSHDTQEAINRLLSELYALLAPPQRTSTLAWANKDRYLSAKNCAKPGKYSTDFAPYIDGILDAVDDPDIPIIVVRKPAQITYTDGVVCNVIGKRIACGDDGTIVVMFPRIASAKDFDIEKFHPMVEVTPSLRDKIDLRRGIRDGSTSLRKLFPTGMLKLVGSNSPADVKSTSAPLTIIEEPDDSNKNVQGQGKTIKLLQERSKSFDNSTCLFGGTPTIKGLSEVDDAFEESDQRHFHVVCHDCNESHILDFKYLQCQEFERWETAFYCCPRCGSIWNDNIRIRNIYLSRQYQKDGRQDAGWIAHQEFRGVAGFSLNELYSSMPGSRHSELMRKKIEAQRLFAKGDDTALIAYVNSTEGRSYEYPRETPPCEELSARAENYAEMSVPLGGLVLTMGVDVQHKRLALVIRAWGRGEESWLVYWGEIFGDTSVSMRDGAPIGVWLELYKILHEPIWHEIGTHVGISAVSIDSGDGHRSDAVYQFVRFANGKNGKLVMAIKGRSKDGDNKVDANVTREVFTPAKPIDVKAGNKASKYGVHIYMVGTSKAKDTILGTRLVLSEPGPGFYHFYQDVRGDYWEQLLSEIKAPRRGHGRQKFWQPISGVRTEALDGEVYAYHAAQALKLHLWQPKRWDVEENKLRQADLLTQTESPTMPKLPAPTKEPSVTVQTNQPAESGFFNAKKTPISKRLA